MNQPDEIKTERLLLRPLTPADAPNLFAVYSHPNAMRFWDTPPHVETAVTQTMINNLLTESACWWAICLPENGRAIGAVGYLGNPGIPGMGYILHPTYWRRGLSSEAVKAALDYGFQKLKLDRVEL